ncbi:hypothetical protein OG455_27305 [Kitasatospora sp. NBC_01287]|uniref:hypothetical protein n=1 Tax=Kitasatospora sp. NBC_01287 TaxID=2903573 RepID=UPI0022519883|nr:hypothetical protein [Kitasatospora sp. NBC_01287]MCX4749167.1 hypothetical protein [Kitasatospora sp. NBC_01287]
MGLRELIIDGWSWLNYKPIMSQPVRSGIGPFGDLAAGWVPPEDLRRLQTYKVLAAYDQNQAGQLAFAAGDENGLDRRELGDPAKLNAAALGYFLGASQQIVVPGAERDQGASGNQPAAAAADMQERLREWARRELLPLRMQQCERSTVRSGDGVYTLAWEPQAGRPVLRTLDPGFFFPEWDDEVDAAEFPERVHFAWELPEDPRTGRKARLRRITYELGPIGAATRPVLAAGSAGAHREWATGPDGAQVLEVGDTSDPVSGVIGRVYPWAPGRPSQSTCYLTDAEWLLEDLKAGQDVYNLPVDKATYRVRADGEVLQGLDLRIDFVPVVHLTNSVPDAGEHWGQPVISRVMQVLDEITATDTDSSAASATTGQPLLAVSGARAQKDRTTGAPVPIEVKPGTVISLGDGGSMSVLDTSAQLAELRERTDHLLDRLAGNSRLTSSGLGTLQPSQVPSGYALALALGPLDSLVGEMRLARAHKYQLLFKFAGRLFQAGRADGWPAGELPAAALSWGPHVPTDRTATLDEVVKGVGAGVFSLETAVRMLAAVGYPIEDAAEEVRRIRASAFEEAARLADATGDNEAVRKFLGLGPAGPQLPKVPLPAGRQDPQE